MRPGRHVEARPSSRAGRGSDLRRGVARQDDLVRPGRKAGAVLQREARAGRRGGAKQTR